jgi:hypothetical protein
MSETNHKCPICFSNKFYYVKEYQMCTECISIGRRRYDIQDLLDKIEEQRLIIEQLRQELFDEYQTNGYV